MRIIALYIQYRDGVPEEDKRRLYQHARLTLAEQDAVNALAYLGSRVTRGPTDKDIRRKLRAKPSQDDEYDLSRFKPLLRTVLEDANTNKLDQSVFPYVKDFPTAAPVSASSSLSLRSGGGSGASSPAPTSLRSQRARHLPSLVPLPPVAKERLGTRVVKDLPTPIWCRMSCSIIRS